MRDTYVFFSSSDLDPLCQLVNCALLLVLAPISDSLRTVTLQGDPTVLGRSTGVRPGKFAGRFDSRLVLVVRPPAKSSPRPIAEDPSLHLILCTLSP